EERCPVLRCEVPRRGKLREILQWARLVGRMRLQERARLGNGHEPARVRSERQGAGGALDDRFQHAAILPQKGRGAVQRVVFEREVAAENEDGEGGTEAARACGGSHARLKRRVPAGSSVFDSALGTSTTRRRGALLRGCCAGAWSRIRESRERGSFAANSGS